jgi:hypothetical protein
VLVATGIVDVDFGRGEVRLHPVEVGTETRQVETPTLRVNTGNNAAPAPAADPPAAPAPAPANAQ